MPKPDPTDALSDMELIEALKQVIYLLMAATDKLTNLFQVIVQRRVRNLRDQRPRPQK